MSEMRVPPLFIYAYWPASRRRQPNIGYGIPLVAAVLLAAQIVLLAGIVAIGVSRAATGLLMWLIVALLIAAVVTQQLMQRGRGYYELDEQGKPTRFLSLYAPDSIQGRKPIYSRQRFRASLPAK